MRSYNLTIVILLSAILFFQIYLISIFTNNSVDKKVFNASTNTAPIKQPSTANELAYLTTQIEFISNEIQLIKQNINSKSNLSNPEKKHTATNNTNDDIQHYEKSGLEQNLKYQQIHQIISDPSFYSTGNISDFVNSEKFSSLNLDMQKKIMADMINTLNTQGGDYSSFIRGSNQ